MKLNTCIFLSIISMNLFHGNYLLSMESTANKAAPLTQEQLAQGTYLSLLPSDLLTLITQICNNEYQHMLPYFETVCIKHDENVKLIACNHDENMVITAVQDIAEQQYTVLGVALHNSTADVRLLDGSFVAWIHGHSGSLYSAAFNPTGDKIVTAAQDKTAKIWSLDGKELVSLEHDRPVKSASFNSAGTKIVTGCWDNTAKIWTLDGVLIVTLIGHNDIVQSASFNQAGTMIATASADKTAKVWDCDGLLLRTLEGHASTVYSAEFNKKGDRIVTASHDKTAKIWTIEGSLVCTLGHRDWVNNAMFNTTDDKIVTSSQDSTVKVWTCNGILLTTLTHGSVVNQVLFTPKTNKILTACGDGNARVWEQPSLSLSLPEALALRYAVKNLGVSLFHRAQSESSKDKISFADALFKIVHNATNRVIEK